MKIRKIFFLLTILCMVTIFIFSNRPGDESAADSGTVGMYICHLFVPGFDSWSPEKQESLAAAIDHPVRKTAHATEYAILGILMYLTLTYSFPEICQTPSRRRFPAAWLLGSIYAASDEFHQLFVPGRSGQLSDVLLDSAGCLVGILICYAVYLCRRKPKTR